MNKTIKCPHCNKVFFNLDKDICPFCNKKINDIPDFFKDIFKTGEE